MRRMVFYSAGTTASVQNAVQNLRKAGISFGRAPGPEITDLLLDIPSFDDAGLLRDGEDPEALFSRLSRGTRVWGGKLPPLEGLIPMDLLLDPIYLKENAAITADCALKLAAPMLPTTWKLSSVLILGWGRIGKQLSRTLKILEAQVTVCARKPGDRALLRAFGYEALEPEALSDRLSQFDLILNTAPARISPPEVLADFHGAALDLASVPGLVGDRVTYARGLPGKLAPKASGRLIAETLLRKGKEVFEI